MLGAQEMSLDILPINVEILNGNGRIGSATKTALFLRHNNVKIYKISNSQSFDYKKTIIVDWKGDSAKSLKLSKLLNIDQKDIIVYDRQDKPIDFTVVVGEDWQQRIVELFVHETGT